MAYLLKEEERWPPGLDCGPDCRCGPCRAKFAGFGERYIPADDDEDEEPEQAPPEEEAAPEGMPESAPPPQAKQGGPAASQRGSRTRRRQRAPRLGGYPLGYWMPALGGWGRFGAVDYAGPFGFYGGFAAPSAEQATLLAAIRRGERNLNKITDMLFYARHPERRGAKLRQEDTGLVREWRSIRDHVVRPALTTAPPTAPYGQPRIPTPLAAGMGTFKQNLARLAIQEWNRWKQGTLKEGDPQMRSTLEDYWRTGAGWLPNHSNWWSAFPWSAAFISWLMKKARAGSAFKYSAAHAEYIKAAKENRLANNTNPFKAYRVSEVTPAVGDLVCKSRAGSGATYDNIQPGMATHCDVVTSSQPNKLITIGGNVADSVSATPVRVDSNGFIQAPNYFAVIKVG